MPSFLKKNCRSDWSYQYCDLGNICAVFAQIIGFTAILPQIYQTWTYRSVDALHVLWPTILETAALTNAFYVFATDDRSFFEISAVYYPLIYMLFLIEFWFFTKKSSPRKLSYAAACIILWACLLTIELSVSFPDGPKKLEWVTIIIYSVKIMPQLMLNIILRTTFGQSSISVLLYCIFSSFSYLSVYLLQADLEYRVMYYMSSSLAYINGIQVLWYPRPIFEREQKAINYGTIIDSQDYSVPFEDRNTVVTEVTEENIEKTIKDIQLVPKLSSSETSYGSSFGNRSQTISLVGYLRRLKEKTWWQILLMLYLLVGLVLFTVGLGVTASTFWTIFGPVSMFAVLFLTSLYRDYLEGSLSCYIFSEIRYKVWES